MNKNMKYKIKYKKGKRKELINTSEYQTRRSICEKILIKKDIELRINDGRKINDFTSKQISSLFWFHEQPEGADYWYKVNKIFEVITEKDVDKNPFYNVDTQKLKEAIEYIGTVCGQLEKNFSMEISIEISNKLSNINVMSGLYVEEFSSYSNSFNVIDALTKLFYTSDD